MPSIYSSTPPVLRPAIVSSIAILHLIILAAFWSEVGGERIYDTCGLDKGDYVKYVLYFGGGLVITSAFLDIFVRQSPLFILGTLLPLWVVLLIHVCH